MTLSGFFRAASTTSLSDLYGELSGTASNISNLAVIEIGAKSVSTLYGSFSKSDALIACPLPTGHVDDSTSARAVFDDELLFHVLGKFVRQEPHGQVADTSRTIRHENPEWLLGVVGSGLRACRKNRRKEIDC